MLTFDPIEDKGWPLRAGYKVEILERLLKLVAIEGRGATTSDQQSDDYGPEIERFFRELTYAWPQGAESRCPALPGPDDILPAMEEAAAWLVANRGWTASEDLELFSPPLKTDEKTEAP